MKQGTARHAVILAAGGGRRLGEDVPKSLVEVGGRPLIEHQLAALEAVGVERTVVVAGFRANLLADVVRGRAEVVVNSSYASTNSLYSFTLAEPHVDGATYVLNGDVLFAPTLLQRLATTAGSAVAIDSSSGQEDEEMKVAVKHGRVTYFSKTLAAARRCGENVGVMKLDAIGTELAFAHGRELIAEGRLSEWFPAALCAVATHHHLRAVDVAGLPWIEIDFPGDLLAARTVVAPAITPAPLARLPRRPLRWRPIPASGHSQP